MGPAAGDLVIISRTLAELAEFLQERQASTGRGEVILDRRVGDRRVATVSVPDNRRRSDRRRPPPESTEALLRVLGFAIVPRPAAATNGARRPAVKPGRRVGRAPARARRAVAARRSRSRR